MGNRVAFSGGTFSAHPAGMLAAQIMMSYLVGHEKEIYPRLSDLGDKARKMIEDAFAADGILARCTGAPNDALPSSSLIRVHFPYRPDTGMARPDEVMNPDLYDVALSEKVLRLALLIEDVNVMYGFGSLSTAHSEADLIVVINAIHEAIARIKQAGWQN
jgi:glutamate-1-semialdehyde 2,1-aminomutase